MKYYILKGFTDSSKDYTPLVEKFDNCEVVESNMDMILNPPEVEESSVLIGFSLGALIAFRISQKQKIKKLIACSMSPFLSEDISLIPSQYRKSWFTDTTELEKLNYKNSKADESFFLCGEKEPDWLKQRTLKMGGKVILGVGHKLSKKYINEILKLF